jgi:hypothetical protein
MDVNSIMNVYNMTSTWNSLSPMNNSSSTTVPLIDNIDSTVQENYNSMNYFGENTNSELQNIYKQIEPNYNIPITYDKNGDITTASNNIGLTTNGLNSNIISLLNSNNTANDNLTQNILSQYNDMENGTLNTSISSILSTNPTNLYNAINLLAVNQSQDLTQNIINTLV